MRFTAAVTILCLTLAAPAKAQETPLGGIPKQLLLGDWVRLDDARGRTMDIALQDCTKPLVPQILRGAPAVETGIEAAPAWAEAQGNLSFFEYDGFLYQAALSGQTPKARLHEHLTMITQGAVAMVIGVNTWTQSLFTGFEKTRYGEALETLPLAIAVQNGLAKPDRFLLQVGTVDGSPIAKLATDVSATGSLTEDSQIYLRCGDISGIIGQ